MELDDQTKFLYRHETRIREWAALLWEADYALTAALYAAVRPRLREFAVTNGLIVHEYEGSDYLYVLLSRAHWPRRQNVNEPAVSVGWELNVGEFSVGEDPPFTGVRAIKKALSPDVYQRLRHAQVDGYEPVDQWWVLWRFIRADEDWFDDPQKWIDDQVAATEEAWETLAPLVDAALAARDTATRDELTDG